jgi:proteasome accessory factor B
MLLAMTRARRPPKVQRWIDLVAALLRYHYPVSFAVLAREVPAYSAGGKKHDAVMRMFERDKDELRALGVPIESLPNDVGIVDRYQLKAKDFYLPYLSVVDSHGVATTPRRPSGYGYQGLPALAFLPDELELVVRAARRVQQLGDSHLAKEAAAALRKLAFDVAISTDAQDDIVAEPRGDDPDVLDALDAAVRRRKTTTFDYRSMERDVTARRTVEPLGLVFMSGAWYLVARDTKAAALRHFRVRRIRDVKVNAARPQTPDFRIPDGFDLGSHASSRNAWELGDGDAVDAVVHFSGNRGVVAEAMKLGEPVGRLANRRRYRVRRVESFARWLLSFSGDARPVKPDTVVESWRDLARRTAALYGSASWPNE